MTNNNPPPMPEPLTVRREWLRDFVDYIIQYAVEDDSTFLGTPERDKLIDHFITGNPVIATPQPARLTVDEVGLLRIKNNNPTNTLAHEYYEGWNDCIDHLRERGLYEPHTRRI